ncbi:MAG: DegT/DnrJ/EryC1/StrS family aminotransferase [Planctomycetota bacterium]
MHSERKEYPVEILRGPFKYSLFKPFVPKKKALELLEECFDSGWIGEGPKVKEFERHICEVVDNKYFTALNSGTSALEMALTFCKTIPQEKDIVITTPMTCMATTIAILNVGLKPYFVDIDPFTGLLSPLALEGIPGNIKEKAAALVTVHWGGNTINIVGLSEFANKHGIMIVEDAAHALGSTTHALDGDSAIVGGWNAPGDFTCFSFQAIKHVTTGDGGGVSFKHKKHWERSKPFKWFGIPRDERKEHILGHSSYDIIEAGRKWQMNDIAASIGIASLSDFKRNLERRRKVAAIYDDYFPVITKKGDFPVSVITSPGSSYWLYTILVRDPYHFSESMRAQEIEVSNVHVRNDNYSVTDGFTGGRLKMPGLDYFSEHAMCIPIGPWITDDDASFIAKKALQFGK